MKNPLLRQNEYRRGGQGDAPLGVPHPLGERGGHFHSFFKFYHKLESEKVRPNFTDQQNNFLRASTLQECSASEVKT
jgi:hypothetical protein